MTEKEAIEILKEAKEIYTGSGPIAIDIVLKALEQKDKEIEEKENNFIKKEKIEEKIEEFERLSAEIRGYDFKCIPEDLKRNDYAVKMLKELLERK